MKKVGRIVVRKGKTPGLFIPFPAGLEPGVWEVREVLGELTLVRIGTPAMRDARLQALGLDELYGERYSSLMTQEELDSTPRVET